MIEFRTEGFNGYAVKYSPFFDSRIAVAASANFGLVGNGRLYILGLTANGIRPEKWYDQCCPAHLFARDAEHKLMCCMCSGLTHKILSMILHGLNRMKTRL